MRHTIREIAYRGEVHRIAEWAEKLGMKDSTLRSRLINHSVEEAFNMPVDIKKSCRVTQAVGMHMSGGEPE